MKLKLELPQGFFKVPYDTFCTKKEVFGSALPTVDKDSFASGNNTTVANGLNSQAMGNGVVTNGNFSFGSGYLTQTYNEGEHAQGKANKSHKGDIEQNTTLSSIGCGTYWNDRKNAVEVMQNGDVYVIGVGNYDGVNVSGKTVQQVVKELENIDLSNYITTEKLNEKNYTTLAEVGTQGYIKEIPTNYVTDEALEQKGYLTTIPAEYITDTELNEKNYTTLAEVEQKGYTTVNEIESLGYIKDTPSETTQRIDALEQEIVGAQQTINEINSIIK